MPCLPDGGRIDGFFNNALAQLPGLMAPTDNINAEEAEQMMQGLMINHLHITQRVLQPMLTQGGGRIVFITSSAGNMLCELKLDQGGWGLLYAAGKAAFSKLAEFVDLEYRERGIVSFHIQPGLTITEAMTASMATLHTLSVVACPAIHRPTPAAQWHGCSMLRKRCASPGRNSIQRRPSSKRSVLQNHMATPERHSGRFGSPRSRAVLPANSHRLRPVALMQVFDIISKRPC